MSDVKLDDVAHAIAGYYDPHLKEDLVSAGVVKDIEVVDDAVLVDLSFGFPVKRYMTLVQQELEGQISELTGISKVMVNVGWQTAAHTVQPGKTPLPSIANVILIASGKGGVGRTTATANLAISLAYEGAKVGVLDADIYSPCLAHAFGAANKTIGDLQSEVLDPLSCFGVQLISLGNMVAPDVPMLWGGEHVSKAIEQLMFNTNWGKLDYLLIDLPAGSGDIHKTIFRHIPISGAVLVTTPQDLAVQSAIRTVHMLKMSGISTIGIIENMAVNTCSACSSHEAIFGQSGGQKLAKDYGVDMIGSLPLNTRLCNDIDEGRPTVIAEPLGQLARIYREIAVNMMATLSKQPFHA
ncbi:MAG: MRP family ATP-binding protein [Gammaproteobacteria bacterium]|nr:MAG: MRP family ATP-binding protein [Gammaproteobacteria bacterium]